MGVYESAASLASEIKNSKEYKAFQKSMQEVRADGKSENLLKDYKMSQMGFQNYRIQNKSIDKKTMKRIESLENKIKNNKKVYNYLKNEEKLIKMMNNINVILSDAVENDYK